MRKLGLLIVLLIVTEISYAGTDLSCTPVVVKTENKNIILPGASEHIYFFNNISKTSLWLDHPVTKPSASAGWSSYLRAGNWSAIVLSGKEFAISCAQIQPGKVNYQDCGKAIAICAPKQVLEKKRKGNYWLVEDKPWDAFVSAIKKYFK